MITNKQRKGKDMEDQKIIDLYTNREERAIHETDKKYGRFMYKHFHGNLKRYQRQ